MAGAGDAAGGAGSGSGFGAAELGVGREAREPSCAGTVPLAAHLGSALDKGAQQQHRRGPRLLLPKSITELLFGSFLWYSTTAALALVLLCCLAAAADQLL